MLSFISFPWRKFPLSCSLYDERRDRDKWRRGERLKVKVGAAVLGRKEKDEMMMWPAVAT